MPEMSPIQRLVLLLARVTLYGLAGLLVLVIGVFTWQLNGPAGFMPTHYDWGMYGVLLTLLLLCLYLARAIGRQLAQNN